MAVAAGKVCCRCTDAADFAEEEGVEVHRTFAVRKPLQAVADTVVAAGTVVGTDSSAAVGTLGIQEQHSDVEEDTSFDAEFEGTDASCCTEEAYLSLDAVHTLGDCTVTDESGGVDCTNRCRAASAPFLYLLYLYHHHLFHYLSQIFLRYSY